MIAIAIGMFGKVVLVFFPSNGEFLQIAELGRDLVTSKGADDLSLVNGTLEFLSNLFSNSPLLLVTTENPTRILKASIVSLSILEGWIVKGKEESQHFFKVKLGVVEFNVEHLDVARLTRADLSIGRVLNTWSIHGAHKSNFCFLDRIGKSFLKIWNQTKSHAS